MKSICVGLTNQLLIRVNLAVPATSQEPAKPELCNPLKALDMLQKDVLPYPALEHVNQV
jgi:hypothetical protein